MQRQAADLCENAPDHDPTADRCQCVDFMAKIGIARGVKIGADRDLSSLPEKRCWVRHLIVALPGVKVRRVFTPLTAKLWRAGSCIGTWRSGGASESNGIPKKQGARETGIKTS